MYNYIYLSSIRHLSGMTGSKVDLGSIRTRALAQRAIVT